MKKFLKWTAIGFGALLLICCGGIVLMPSDWAVETSVVIDAPAAKIYPYFAQPRKWVKIIELYAAKQPDYESATFTYTFSETKEGPGAWWISETESGGVKSKVRIEYTKGGPEEGLWYDGAIDQDEVNDHGSVLFEAVDGGTKVTWSDSGTVPLSRGGGLTAMAIGPMLEPFFQGALLELETVVESGVQIEDAE